MYAHIGSIVVPFCGSYLGSYGAYVELEHVKFISELASPAGNARRSQIVNPEVLKLQLGSR